MTARESPGVWLPILVGALYAALALKLAAGVGSSGVAPEGSGDTEGIRAAPHRLRASLPTRFRRLSSRDLRRIPGIGPVRAARIVQQRWTHERAGEPLELSEVNGLGPTTEAALLEWLDARGIRADGLVRSPND